MTGAGGVDGPPRISGLTSLLPPSSPRPRADRGKAHNRHPQRRRARGDCPLGHVMRNAGKNDAGKPGYAGDWPTRRRKVNRSSRCRRRIGSIGAGTRTSKQGDRHSISPNLGVVAPVAVIAYYTFLLNVSIFFMHLARERGFAGSETK